MSDFFERLIVRAATIDELLSDDFETLPGQKSDTDKVGRRLAAWCRSSASGDWSLFLRRLERDGLGIGHVLERLGSVRHNPTAPRPAWIEDAIWVEGALSDDSENSKPLLWPESLRPFPFENLFYKLAEQAEARLWSAVDAPLVKNFSEAAQVTLRHALVKSLSELCAPVLYELFSRMRKRAAKFGPSDESPSAKSGTLYNRFLADLKAGGLRQMFEEKPVLLRLVVVLTRQWIDASQELVLRLGADLDAIRQTFFSADAISRVAAIEGDLSDPHNCGRTVQILHLENGSRFVYKPKDLLLDAAWYALIHRLNASNAPTELKAVRVIVRDGYGWAEFVDHKGCEDAEGVTRFFGRAGAWLALFHCFVCGDMHEENVIAAGDHPIPIDLETVLQAEVGGRRSNEPQSQAFEAVAEIVANSVMMVGLLPAYGRSHNNDVFAIGGLKSGWKPQTRLSWSGINTDEMRPVQMEELDGKIPNLPYRNGIYATFGDHVEEFVRGFEGYADFLKDLGRTAPYIHIFDEFVGAPVRMVVRPTRFYYHLLQRLKNHATMDDGAIWSAQVDFIARLSDWDNDVDPLWPLQRAERAALQLLNVPHFVSSSDGLTVSDMAGVSVRIAGMSGIRRASERMQAFDKREISWQVAVIRQNTASLSRSNGLRQARPARQRILRAAREIRPLKEVFIAEADRVAEDLDRYGVCRGTGAAWIGLDTLGGSNVSQLVALGMDLYAGTAGIAVFLAAHYAVSGRKRSRELALAAVAQLRQRLVEVNAARTARLLGVGGGTGLGSIVYGLTVVGRCLQDESLVSDAHLAAELFTDDLISADDRLDVIGGAAGGILGLLRLYRESSSSDALRRAVACGEHLLAQPRHGSDGRRTWMSLGVAAVPLTGMSHGASGFAYALTSLANATGRDDFADAAKECILFEESTFDAEHTNWPDFREMGAVKFPCQWCHGATGIGLARVGMSKFGAGDTGQIAGSAASYLATDIAYALAGVERDWPSEVDTLCCGTLGSIEFCSEAGSLLSRNDLLETAARRLVAVLETAASSGDYRWGTGNRNFNLGLFRGLAGVGYTCLRQADRSLPNVLIWE